MGTGHTTKTELSNIFSEENLLQDQELQVDSNTRSLGLRHYMFLSLKEETLDTIITFFAVEWLSYKY